MAGESTKLELFNVSSLQEVFLSSDLQIILRKPIDLKSNDCVGRTQKKREGAVFPAGRTQTKGKEKTVPEEGGEGIFALDNGACTMNVYLTSFRGTKPVN